MLQTRSIARQKWGMLGGREISLYTLTNANGVVMSVTNYGAIITAVRLPDGRGETTDVVAGFDTLEGYVDGHPYFGAIVGRVANRIRSSNFELGGKRYALASNNGRDHLHGGNKGFDKVVWQADAANVPSGPAVELRYVSPDGEEGYPGTLTSVLRYVLTDDDELVVEMSASTDATTLVNLAQHTYWNLAGGGTGTILDHELMLYADAYTPGDPMIPTGEVAPVAGTPFDFTTDKPVGRDIARAGGDPVGYDHNFIVRGNPDELRPVATVRDPKSKRTMTLHADQPGVQFYSGNFLDGSLRGKGTTYVKHAALCLETQKFPNSINVPAWRNQVILEPSGLYRHKMVHKFGMG